MIITSCNSKDQSISNTESNVEKSKKGMKELVSILKVLCKISHFPLRKIDHFCSSL